MSLIDKLEKVRAMASDNGVPVRRKDGVLYRLLAACLELCEEVERDGLELELREAVRVSVNIRNEGNRGKGRRYVEHGSHVTVLVCRYVLADDVRNSPYRYGMCLREAMRRQINSAGLEQWLVENGGLNTLYKTRPLALQSETMRTLHLNSAVTVPKGGRFTLTLERDHRGFFYVYGNPVLPHGGDYIAEKIA